LGTSVVRPPALPFLTTVFLLEALPLGAFVKYFSCTSSLALLLPPQLASFLAPSFVVFLLKRPWGPFQNSRLPDSGGFFCSVFVSPLSLFLLPPPTAPPSDPSSFFPFQGFFFHEGKSRFFNRRRTAFGHSWFFSSCNPYSFPPTS